VRTRWGLSPCAFQMRCTLVWMMPISSAIIRTLQCVALRAAVAGTKLYITRLSCKDVGDLIA
jgi:hypothetical protein